MKALLLSLIVSTSLFAEAANRLRVVLINDGANSHKRGANLSTGCDANRGGWENFLSNAFQSAPERLSIDVVQGDDSSPTGIRSAIQDLTLGTNENIFVYYCGHGGWDREKGHFLMMGLEGNMLRSELRTLLLAKGARAILLITDACTSVADFSFFPQAPEEKFPLFYDLFLQVQGLVDISSSTQGQESWFNKLGSVFSNEFSLAIARGKDGYDKNRDGLVTWTEFFPQLRVDVDRSFQDLKSSAPNGSPIKKAAAQTPAYYFLAEWPQYTKYVVAENGTNERVRLTIHFVALSPETRTWQWYPAKDAPGLTYDLEPNRSTPLLLKPEVAMVAARVSWSARGIDSDFNYGSADATVAPSSGYSVQSDPSAVNYKIAIARP